MTMPKTSARFIAALLALLAVCLVPACATTDLVGQWKSPEYAGGPLRKVLVLGVSKQTAVRRVFEDEFCARLRMAGVDAIPSYTLLAEDGQADQAVLEALVKDSGADGVMVTRLVKQERKTEVSPGIYYPPIAMGMYGWYASRWYGYYEPPTVYQYDVVTAETSVYSPPQSRLLWSGTTQTFSPRDVRKDTAGFAKVIIAALKKQGLI